MSLHCTDKKEVLINMPERTWIVSVAFRPRWQVFDSSPPGCATCAKDAAQEKTYMALEGTCSVPGTQVNGSSVCENDCYKALCRPEIAWAHAKWHPAMYLCI